MQAFWNISLEGGTVLYEAGAELARSRSAVSARAVRTPFLSPTSSFITDCLSCASRSPSRKPPFKVVGTTWDSGFTVFVFPPFPGHERSPTWPCGDLASAVLNQTALTAPRRATPAAPSPPRSLKDFPRQQPDDTRNRQQNDLAHMFSGRWQGG